MMHPLTAHQTLQIWELGQFQHPLERALTLLAFALPDQPRECLERLSIGQRDAYLLALRERTLGSKLESFAECPHCGEALEFTLDAASLKVATPTLEAPPSYVFTAGDLELQFRLPSSVDLGAIALSPNLPTAQYQLTERCIQQVSQGGNPVSVQTLPPDVLTQLSQHMATCDPQAEMLLDLVCPACEHVWQVLFDIASFFWSELTVQAKRLLREVHTLARYYGWREADILAMSPMRRQFYLDLVS